MKFEEYNGRHCAASFGWCAADDRLAIERVESDPFHLWQTPQACHDRLYCAGFMETPAEFEKLLSLTDLRAKNNAA